MIDLDLGELTALGEELAGAAGRVLAGVKATTAKAALNVKTQMRREAQGVAHAPGLPASITYDVSVTGDGVTAEIGPVKGHVGSLALLYLGNSKSGPRLPDPMGALEREAPAWEQYVADAVAQALLP